MKTAMESIRDMVDVNTIVGDPVEAQDGTVIVPISRVSFGFAAGGAEYSATGRRSGGGSADGGGSEIPFGGGSGAGVTIRPMGFLVVGPNQVRMLPVDGRAYYDRLIDLVPQVLQELTGVVRGNGGGYTAPIPPAGRRVRSRPEV